MLTTIVSICKDKQQFLEFSECSHGNAVFNFLKSFEKMKSKKESHNLAK